MVDIFAQVLTHFESICNSEPSKTHRVALNFNDKFYFNFKFLNLLAFRLKTKQVAKIIAVEPEFIDVEVLPKTHF